jgi:hypothetical protein
MLLLLGSFFAPEANLTAQYTLISSMPLLGTPLLYLPPRSLIVHPARKRPQPQPFRKDWG